MKPALLTSTGMIKDLLLKHKTAVVNSTQNIFLITWNQANWTFELLFPLLIEWLHNMTGLKKFKKKVPV